MIQEERFCNKALRTWHNKYRWVELIVQLILILQVVKNTKSTLLHFISTNRPKRAQSITTEVILLSTNLGGTSSLQQLIEKKIMLYTKYQKLIM